MASRVRRATLECVRVFARCLLISSDRKEGISERIGQIIVNHDRHKVPRLGFAIVDRGLV